MIKKTLYAFLLMTLSITATVWAKMPQINGFWQSSSGAQFEVAGRQMGFIYKNVGNNSIVQAGYIGNNSMGFPMYRADFVGPFPYFILFTIESSIRIYASDSRNPNIVNIWNRIQ